MTKDELTPETEPRELPPLPEPSDMPPPPEALPEMAPPASTPEPPGLEPTAPKPTAQPKSTQKRTASKPKKPAEDPDTVHATTAAPEESAPKPKTVPKSQSTREPRADERPKSTKPKTNASGSTANPTAPKKGNREQIDLELPRSSRPAHRVIPYLLLALSIFLGLCFLLNLFCNANNRCAEDPSSHLMGTVGYGICYGLFGTFGPAAFLIPVLILNLSLCWKRYVDSKLLPEKALVSALLLIFMSALIHSFSFVTLNRAEWAMSSEELLFFGARIRGGGLIGGGIGYFLASNMNVVGAILVSLFCTVLTLFFFLGMTPRHVWERIRTARELKHSRTVPIGVDDEENIRNEMKRKHQRAANRGAVTEEETAPPEGAVEVVKTANRQKTKERMPDDIPIPVLDGTRDGTDGVTLFIPNEFRKTAEKAPAEAAAAEAPAPNEKKDTAPTPVKEEHPTPQKAAEEAPKAIPLPAPKPPSQRPTSAASEAQAKAMEAMFPRSHAETKNLRRVQKSDLNFELGSIFVDTVEEQMPKEKVHMPLPDEVPMPGSTPRPRPAEGTEAAPEAGVRRATPTPPPKRPPMDPNRPRRAPAAGAELHKPVLRQISQEVNYEPSEEALEKHESELQRLAGSTKAPAAPKAPVAQKPVTPKPAMPKPPAAEKPKPYVFPPISYLTPSQPMTEENHQEIAANTDKLTQTLGNFGVRIEEITYSYGPTVTRYEIFPSSGVRVRTITNLADDIALAFAVPNVRMEAIAGKSAIGVEVPNTTRQTVFLRDLIESEAFTEKSGKLTAGLGADVTGHPLLFDISKMPHLLVAGATGMGKSVCINCIITSILYKARPDEVKLVLIDPKKVEFALYKGIPHLMAPIILTPKDAAGALQAAVNEMEDRFNKIQEVGVHDIAGYNKAADKDPELEHMPQIVIIIDELADLMMTAKDEVETSICRLAQKARAAGMHIIIGTQRPSVDVVTGLIKANIPSRIACTVASQTDSRTIMDIAGAEKLLGRGDMLFSPVGAMKPTRVQGAFISSDEVEHICEFIRATNGTAVYNEAFTSKMKEYSAMCGNKKGKGSEELASIPGGGGDGDNKYVEAIRICMEEKRVSTSLLQRKLSIGYSRAAKLIDRMEEEGFVGKADGSKARPILITAEQFIERFSGNGDNGGEETED